VASFVFISSSSNRPTASESNRLPRYLNEFPELGGTLIIDFHIDGALQWHTTDQVGDEFFQAIDCTGGFQSISEGVSDQWRAGECVRK